MRSPDTRINRFHDRQKTGPSPFPGQARQALDARKHLRAIIRRIQEENAMAAKTGLRKQSRTRSYRSKKTLGIRSIQDVMLDVRTLFRASHAKHRHGVDIQRARDLRRAGRRPHQVRLTMNAGSRRLGEMDQSAIPRCANQKRSRIDRPMDAIQVKRTLVRLDKPIRDRYRNLNDYRFTDEPNSTTEPEGKAELTHPPMVPYEIHRRIQAIRTNAP